MQESSCSVAQLSLSIRVFLSVAVDYYKLSRLSLSLKIPNGILVTPLRILQSWIDGGRPYFFRMALLRAGGFVVQGFEISAPTSLLHPFLQFIIIIVIKLEIAQRARSDIRMNNHTQPFPISLNLHR